MYIRETKDSNYPYEIGNSWGQIVNCSLDDLKEIKKKINKILKEEKEKS